tara:strand:- start:459 stop:1427 length:969 start_codon:yes stop_codon:yes gene_type:complete
LNTSKKLIVIPADSPTQIEGSPHLDILKEHAEVKLYSDFPSTQPEKMRRVENADVLINSRSSLHWSGEEFTSLPKLKMMSTCSVGTDGLDLDGAKEAGIIICNQPGSNAPFVSEHAIALMLGVAKRTSSYTAQLKAGIWSYVNGVFLTGKTLGIIGTGNIGKQTAQMAKALGMNVIAWTYNPNIEWSKSTGINYVDLDQLLQTSDVVSLHTRLSPDTEGFIGEKEIKSMKPGAILINVGRGALIDTPAMVTALHSGQLGGAGLDVFDVEPLTKDHPILECDNVVLTPHTADVVPEGVDVLNSGTVKNVLAFLEGKPINIVNP